MMARNPHGKKHTAASHGLAKSSRATGCRDARQQGQREPGDSAEVLLRLPLDHTTSSRHLALPTRADIARKTSQQAPAMFCLRFPNAHLAPASKSIQVWHPGRKSFQKRLAPLAPTEGEHPSSPQHRIQAAPHRSGQGQRGSARSEGCKEERGFCLARFARLFFFSLM